MLDMAFFDHKTLAEIAEETGFPIDLVASRLHGAISSLRSGSADAASTSEDTGLEVLDLDTHAEFTMRSLHTRDVTVQMEGLRGLPNLSFRIPIRSCKS